MAEYKKFCLKSAADAPKGLRMAGGCEFSCDVTRCEYLTDRWGGLLGHLSRQHGIDPTSRNPNKYLKKKSTHSCKVCGKELLADHSIIAYHVRVRIWSRPET